MDSEHSALIIIKIFLLKAKENCLHLLTQYITSYKQQSLLYMCFFLQYSNKDMKNKIDW